MIEYYKGINPSEGIWEGTIFVRDIITNIVDYYTKNLKSELEYWGQFSTSEESTQKFICDGIINYMTPEEIEMFQVSLMLRELKK
jgi:hypothetical protein